MATSLVPLVSARARALAYALAALLALAVRVPVLAVAHPSPDAAEYLLIARSIARGDGFTLPIKVRHDVPGPAVHEAFGDRAPLFPLFLAPFAGKEGPIAPAHAWPNAVLAAVAAALGASLAHALARARPLSPSSALASAGVAGVLLALHPPLVRISAHLWAEPLAIVLALAALRLDVEAGGVLRGAAAGTLASLARLARPEAIAPLVAPLFARVARREPRAVAAFLLAALAVTSASLGVAGFGPQGFLGRVGWFEDVMANHGHAPPPAPSVLAYVSSHPGEVAGQVLDNLRVYAGYSLKCGWPVLALLPLALRRGSRTVLAASAVAFVAPALVWATQDWLRFPALAVALVTPLVVVEGEAARVALSPRAAGAALAAFLVVAVGWLGAQDVRIALECTPLPAFEGPEHEAVARRLREGLAPGEAFAAAKPWGLALSTGRPAVLLPSFLDGDGLRALLRAQPEVRAVVIRPWLDQEGKQNPEPVAHLGTLKGRVEEVGAHQARIVWLEAPR